MIAVEGPHHSLLFLWQAYGSSQWNPEQVAGAVTTYSGPSVAESNNTNAIAVEGPDHSLDYYWQTYNTTQWNERGYRQFWCRVLGTVARSP